MGQLATMARRAGQNPKDIVVESTDTSSPMESGKDGDWWVLGRLPREEDIGGGALMDEVEFTRELGIQVEGIACAATAGKIELAGLEHRAAAAALFVCSLLGWVFPHHSSRACFVCS